MGVIAQLVLAAIVPRVIEDLAKVIEESENPEELRHLLSLAAEVGGSNFEQFQHEVDKHGGWPDPDCKICVSADRV